MSRPFSCGQSSLKLGSWTEDSNRRSRFEGRELYRFPDLPELEPNRDRFELAMRSFLQSMLIVMSVLGFLAPAYDLAQSPKACADMVLEVIATHTTMESEDTYVYLRV